MIRTSISYRPVGVYRKPVIALKSEGSLTLNPNYEQEVIDEAVENMKKTEEEKKLLELVVKQPESDEKTKILEKKFRINKNDGIVDDFVDKTKQRIAQGLTYRYDCYFPMDDSVDKKLRDNDYLRTLGPFIDTDLPADEYYYHFPSYREIDGLAVLYKLDNMNVYVYADGSIDESKSVKDSLYGLLYDLKENNDSVKTKYKQLVEKLGIFKGNTVNFAIKGLGIKVVKKIIKRDFEKEAEEEVAEEEDLLKDFVPLPVKPTEYQMINKILVHNDKSITDKAATEMAKKIRTAVKRKLELPDKSKLRFTYIETPNKSPLMIPLISRIKRDTYYIVVINKGGLGLNISALEKYVKAFNLAMMNSTSLDIKQSFASKLEDLNRYINDDKYKIKIP